MRRSYTLPLVAALAVVAPGSTKSWGQAKDLPNQIDSEVVKSVKQATVYLKVTSESGQVSEGSGFLAVEPGIVVTNAHVIGMLGANSKPPAKVTVTVHSGETNELQLVGKVLGVDRTSDIAVLRVEGKLPPPLQFGTNDELFETQKVYILGFPFGAQLGKNITVSESSISSLRKDGRGMLEQIQVNGGMHPGNSGGPVVNAKGQVVGVSVAVIKNTTINFAVPAQTARSLLDGRLLEVKAGQLFRENDVVRVPLQCACLDPFQRIKEVRVEIWAGKPMTNRPFSTKEAQPQPGDGERQIIKLMLREDTAVADVVLPKVAEGEVAWVQPVLAFAKGEPQFGAPQSFEPALAIERNPTLFDFKMAEQKERTVHLKSGQSATLTKGKQKLVAGTTIELDILEAFSADAKGYRVQTGFGPPQMFQAEDDKKLRTDPQVTALLMRVAPSFIVDETNRLRSRVNINLNPSLPAALREQVDDCVVQICNAYEAANFVMPNRQMRARDKWTAPIPMLMKTGTKPLVVDLVLNCTYEGVRTRKEESEALVSFTGRVNGRAELKDRLDGDVHGQFTFDTKRGFISSVKMTISTEASSPDGDASIVFAFNIDLQRKEGNLAKIELPNRNPPVVVKKDNPMDPPVVVKKDNPMPPETMIMDTKFIRPAVSKTPTSYLKIESMRGDTIGEGKTFDFRGSDLNTRIIPRGMQTSVDGWTLRVRAPMNQTLKEGEFFNARRFDAKGVAPELEFSGKGRYSNSIVGEFVVWEIDMKDNKVNKLAVDFVQRAADKAMPLKGRLRINSSLE